MMTWLLFLHVLAGTLWVGGAMWAEAQVAGARKDGGEAQARAMLKAQAVNSKVYPAATVVLIGTAIWMIVAQDRLSWGTLWIDLSTGLFVLLFLNGLLYFDRGHKRLAARLAADGYTAEVGAGAARMHMVGRVEVVLLVALVWLMVFKPV